MANISKPAVIPPILIFSDLDGTLLDRASYSAADASDALAILGRARIPLVLCSSKTRAEIQLLQQQLGIHHPFISENGGALYIPDGYFGFDVPHARPSSSGYSVVQYGRPYNAVVEALGRAARRARIPVLGFNEMSVDEVSRERGLSLLAARLAKLREFSEPFRILTDGLGVRRRIEQALNAEGFGCSVGGRFDQASAHTDQGLAVRFLITLYQRSAGRVRTVGLGDDVDDVPLLTQVDVPIVVRGDTDAQTSRLLASVRRAVPTRASGPAGWAEHVKQIVAEAIDARTSTLGPFRAAD